MAEREREDHHQPSRRVVAVDEGRRGVAQLSRREQAIDVETAAGRFEPTLLHSPLTFRQTLNPATPAALTLTQDARVAMPQVALTDDTGREWIAARDLLRSTADERRFVVEMTGTSAGTTLGPTPSVEVTILGDP